MVSGADRPRSGSCNPSHTVSVSRSSNCGELILPGYGTCIRINKPRRCGPTYRSKREESENPDARPKKAPSFLKKSMYVACPRAQIGAGHTLYHSAKAIQRGCAGFDQRARRTPRLAVPASFPHKRQSTSLRNPWRKLRTLRETESITEAVAEKTFSVMGRPVRTDRVWFHVPVLSGPHPARKYSRVGMAPSPPPQVPTTPVRDPQVLQPCQRISRALGLSEVGDGGRALLVFATKHFTPHENPHC